MRLTRPLHSVFSAGDSLIDRLLCVAGAVLCSQLPEFIQQYLQRLGGHLDEADDEEHRRVQAALDLGLAGDARDRLATGEAVTDGGTHGTTAQCETTADEGAGQFDRLLHACSHLILLFRLHFLV